MDYRLCIAVTVLTIDKVEGGGVLIAVKNCFNSKRIMVDDKNVEQVWTQVSLRERLITFGAVYIPPSANIESYNCFMNTVTNVIAPLDDVAEHDYFV